MLCESVSPSMLLSDGQRAETTYSAGVVGECESRRRGGKRMVMCNRYLGIGWLAFCTEW